MDASQALKATENSLRDVFSYVLQNKFGAEWLTNIGVTQERVISWKSRKLEEQRRIGRSDPRLIYYSDFYDLRSILRKNWVDGLSEIFCSELKEIELLLKILEEFRNPDAHRRELLPYETQLVLGITGKIRSQISLFYNNMQHTDSYFCRIDTIQDSLGNSWNPSSKTINQANNILRPGQRLEFNVAGSDPQGQPVLYGAYELLPPFNVVWKETGDFAFEITDWHISEHCIFTFAVKSKRPYSATHTVNIGKCDHYMQLSYIVLPRIEC